MTAITYALPGNDHTFDLEERIGFYQEIASRLFAAGDWWRAFRAMGRVDALCRQLAPVRNPMATMAAALRGRPVRPDPVRPDPEPPGVDLRTADLTGNTAEQNHAIYVEALRRLRAKAAEIGQRPISEAEMFDWFARHHGHQIAAGVGRIMAERAQAGPSG